MSEIHDYEKNYRRLLNRIGEMEMISSNKQSLFGFRDHLLSEGIMYARIIKYLFVLIKFNNLYKTPFENATEADIRRIVGEINQTSLKESTKRDFRLTLRRFYVYLRGYKKKGVYPPEVEWISLKMSEHSRKMPEELITEEEAKRIISYAETMRDKALIASLAETGARVSEIGTMRIKHVSFEQYGARLTINGKTGMRKVLVISSSPYLQQWINQHPKNNDPEEYLWYNPRGKLLKYARIATILRTAAKRAGIKKKIYPHLLRHSRATQMASLMTEAPMKQYFGWTQSSRMAGIYVHMSGKDTDEAVLRASGIEIKKEIKDNPMKPITCLRCKIINEATNRCCKQCGFILQEAEAQKIIQTDMERKEFDGFMNKVVQNKELLNMLVEKLIEMKK